MNILLTLSIIAGLLSLLFLVVLHFTSSEFDPSWRMVSEYALGKHKWQLTMFFYLWGSSSILLAIALLFTVSSFWAYAGVLLLFASGIGAVCGGLFDVNHRLHGMSFGLGVPTFPVAALLITYHLVGNVISDGTIALVLAHASWITILLMVAGMMQLFAGFKKAGIKYDKDSPPPSELPKGLIAFAGYANRLLVVCYILWNIYMAYRLKSLL